MAESSCLASDGNVMCGMPNVDGVSGCGCNPNAPNKATEIEKIDTRGNLKAERKRTWGSSIAFVIGCLLSPCCSVLYVPLLLLVFAGTPIAAWIGANVGWIYGALTLLSFASFGLAWWYSEKSRRAKRSTVESKIISQNEIEVRHA